MSPSLDALEARWGRTGAVTFAERYGGPVALLQAGGATAVVALQGAQVLSYVPQNQSDALWLSPVAKLGTGVVCTDPMTRFEVDSIKSEG